MKKIRFFAPGSAKEGRFLQEQLMTGRVLTRVSLCHYEFSIVNKKYQLVREFSNSCLSTTQLQEIQTELALASLVQHPLTKFGKHYWLLYSYVPASEQQNTVTIDGYADFTGDPQIELAYRQKRLDLFLIWQCLLSFSFACIWSLWSIGEFGIFSDISKALNQTLLRVPFFIYLLIIWLLPLLWKLPIKQRIRQILTMQGDSTNEWSPELMVILNNPKTTPNISELAFIGNWRLLSHKKNIFTYRLRSLMNEDDIRTNIALLLEIPEDNIQIVSSWGLFGIGGF